MIAAPRPEKERLDRLLFERKLADSARKRKPSSWPARSSSMGRKP